MDIKTLKVGPLEANCYILSNKKEAVVIDPGGDAELIIGELEKRSLKPKFILNTHGHHDHVLANDELSDFANKAIHIHPEDVYLLTSQLSLLPELMLEKNYKTVDLAEGQELEFDDEKILVMHTPGHTKGSVSFLVAGNLFCGDLLFKQSIGRTDLEGSSPEDMIKSLQRVMKMDKKITVYPGHGPSTNIGEEVSKNPFLGELNL